MSILNLSDHYMERIQKAYHLIKAHIPQGEIYLFGSYAKRKIKPCSDIDMLVLLDEELDKKTIRNLKWEVEEIIEEAIQFEYEVDLKIYTKEHFEKSKEILGFESDIAGYMIKLEESLWK
ncbi:MAG: nucleotidyltransferase domain-containing protein [Cellulosilyticaceae bacterium]